MASPISSNLHSGHSISKPKGPTARIDHGPSVTETPVSLLPLPPQQPCGLTQDLVLPGFPLITTPRLIYGTAWNNQDTARLVYLAIKSGFRGIDTAALPLYYQERLVGDGVRRAVDEGIVTRKELYIQTKFAPPDSEEYYGCMPYDRDMPLKEKVKASVESSLKNFAISCPTSPQPAYLDCVLLNTPLPTIEETVAVWQTLEEFVPHRIRRLGIANVHQMIVEHLLQPPIATRSLAEWKIRVRPSVVQNHFCTKRNDKDNDVYFVKLRRLCRQERVVFQSYYTLRGNERLIRKSTAISDLVARVPGVSRETAFYALVLGLRGTSVLNGTKSEDHMRADIEGIKQIERWADGEGRLLWESLLHVFKRKINEEE
ncbi:d-xylose reductase II III [Apiospora rasikravindrae]|uniref:D-xylose reductase II III n=1 Tax=Apiospora rasikravindrae TaxID=990691 RepID=A0ABR1SY04_9PEZI